MSTIIANRYKLLDKVGEGGMGAVYRATDRLTRQIIALKRVTVRKELLQFTSMGEHDDFRTALAQEFKVLASLRHPNIISVLDYGFDADLNPFFTMDYLPDARSIIDFSRDLSIVAKVEMLLQILQSLVYLHRHKILHRDLKPANILLTADNQIMLLDFGLSTTVTEASGTSGTLMYMAPEVLRSQPITEASDLYSLGVIAYEILIGRYPFPMQNPTSLVVDILQTQPNVSGLEDERLRAILTRWLSKDPQTRYQHADELIAALNETLGLAAPPENIAVRESFIQSARFVGRQQELDQLLAALNRVKQGHGSAWLIGGESGVGKSRLLDEFRTAALVDGAMVVRGVSAEGSGIPYHLWRDIVRRLVLSAEVTDLEASILAEIVPDIATLIERDQIPDAPELNAAFAQERLSQIIISLLRRQKQTTVLFLEDLHWATSESLNLLKKLIDDIGQSSLLIIGSYRNDESPDLPARLPGAHLLSLSRFDGALIEELSVSILGETGRRAALVDLLRQETEGNAFFLVEAMRALAEDAGQLNEVGRLTLPEHIITGGIQEVVRRRVTRLPADAYFLLKLSAVIGRKIDLPVLQQVESPQVIEDWLMTCMNASILDVQENSWQFAHDKLREFVLQDLAPEERRQFHQQAAQAIEALYGSNPAYAAILADHWHRADNLPKEVDYACIATEQAVSITSYKNAIAFGERAAAGLADHDSRKVNVLRWMGDAYFGSGDPAKAKSLYETALAVSDHVEDKAGKAQVLYALSSVAAMQWDYEAWQQYAEEAFKIADDKKNRAYGLMILGSMSRIKGEYERGQTYLDQSMALFQEVEDLFGIAAIFNDRGIFANQRGHFAEAKVNLQECLALMRRIGNQRTIAISLCNLGLVAVNQGEYAEANTLFQEALKITRDTGDRNILPTVLNRIAFGQAHQGDFGQAQAYFEECVAVCRELNNQTVLAQPLAGLASLAGSNGKFDEAHQYAEEALGVAKNVGAWIHSAVLFAKGNILSLQGDYAAARATYDEGLTLLAPLDEPWRRVQIKAKLGSVLVLLDQPDEGQRVLREVLGDSLNMGAYPIVLDALVGYARLYLTSDPARSARLVSLIANHPALSAIDTEPWLGDLFAEARQRLPITPFAVAVDEGERLDLVAVVNEILDEWQ